MLNPIFNGNFIRSLTPTFYEVAHKVIPRFSPVSFELIARQMRECISEELNGSTKDVSIFTWIHRTSLEMLGRGGLGYSLDRLDVPPSDEYGETLKAVS